MKVTIIGGGPGGLYFALLEHRAVHECAVVGWPDEERGMIVKAFVVLKTGYARDAAMIAALQDLRQVAAAPEGEKLRKKLEQEMEKYQ